MTPPAGAPWIDATKVSPPVGCIFEAAWRALGYPHLVSGWVRGDAFIHPSSPTYSFDVVREVERRIPDYWRPQQDVPAP